jgi:GAF domain-containing protein
VVAVVELLDTAPREPDVELLRTLTALGDQMGLAIQRRRAERPRTSATSASGPCSRPPSTR